MKFKFAQAFVMGLCLYSATAGAVPWDKPTDDEIAVLPPYCLAKFRGVAVEQWQNTLGSIYLHVHHYCGALVEINRYYKSSDKQDRKFLIQNSIGNLDYMISHAEQSSALMPEIYFTKGRILVLDGRNAEAVKEFLQAIRLKPDYADPYAAMADFYARIEKKQDALKILQEGLRQIPTSRKLARRYQELGGKLPRPEANPPLAETAKPETQPPVPVETAKKVLEAAPVAARQAPEPEPASPSERPPEKIGSPSNPWCRFCTDDMPVPAGK